MSKEKRNLEYKIKCFINKREMSKKDIEICSKIITEYSEYVETDDEINKFNIFCAKLLFKADKFEDSKKYLEYVEDSCFSKYYLYFKIFIREGKYKEAYENLKMYEKFYQDKKSINLTIYYYLFSLLYNEIDETILLNGYFNNVKMDKDLNILVNELISDLLEQDYKDAINKLDKMQKYVEDNNIPLDFKELKILINRLSRKRTINNNNKDINVLVKEAFYLVHNAMYLEALNKLYEVRDHLNYKKVSYEYKLIKKYIKEQLKIADIYNSDKAIIYNEIKRFGELNSYFNDNYIACQYYLYGIYEFDIPEFYYKVGKYYFSIGEQNKAVKYFMEYIKKGGFEYLSEVYQYLSKCNSVFNIKKRERYIEKSNRVRNIIKSLSGKKTKKIDNPLNVRKYDYNEVKSIIVDFNLYPTNKKIEDISALYESGYIELAETLYREFHDVISGDEHLQYERKKLERDRLFYINQPKQLIL